MNKLRLIVMLVAAGGLVVFMLARGEVDTRARLPEPPQDPKEKGYLQDCGGVKTDQTAEFDIQVEAKQVGPRNVLEFTITETHGWCVQGVYVRFWHRSKNEETGEWQREASFEPVTHLCNQTLKMGEPLVCETTLTGVELGLLNGVLGESEQWEAEVEKYMAAYMPE